ncbi:hypothetical protein H257_17058 [Aphanomyces astaci]|uniref:Uncharacterized protein n=1 Tax=Aphanomyces astaci TaxID=112090 RepID=W4FG33_APHAT|nr:hypothetical protein H257_17058 [Aphanomyces astaci]ETV66472.1 hypothetical protein H257_17058 [Aphanomyces astaci]|eukprot:XP_009844001.1 hypothetical protein H257_17058 [Aphanomyces astaci]
MTALAAALGPWLNAWGLSRLPKLFACLPHMQRVVMLVAIWNNRLDVVQYLHKTVGLEWFQGDKLLDVAARCNHLGMVLYLHEHGCGGCTADAMDAAAGNGNLAIVRYLHQHRGEGGTKHGCFESAKNGHLDVLTYLNQHVTAIDHNDEGWINVFDEVATNGHLETVQYLHPYVEKCTSSAMDDAAKNGHLDVVQWLHVNRHEGCSYEAMVSLASGLDKTLSLVLRSTH